MTTPVPNRKYTAGILSASAAIAFFLAVAASPANAATGMSPCLPSDTILVEKQLTSKKYKIRLYPSATHEVLFFSAAAASGDGNGKIYQFFLFDMEGNLVKQANIRNKQTTVLNNIEKGTYLFEIFSNDERIENGKVIVR